MPAVSVIVPTFNRAQLVTKAVRSVLEQTFDDLELLVVDDGSTDNTLEILQVIGDPRLQRIAQTNKGPAAARNAGLKACRGRYLAFLDSDDLFTPDKIERQVAFLDSHAEVGLCYTAYRGIDEVGAVDPIVVSRGWSGVDLKRLLLGPAVKWSTVLVSRRWTDVVGRFDESLRQADEWEWMLRLALAGCQMGFLPEPLVYSRVHTGGLVRQPGRTSAEGLRVLERTFRSPFLPARLKGLYALARGQVFARESGLAIVARDGDATLMFAQKAVAELAPPSDADLRAMALTIVHISRGLSLEDPSSRIAELCTRLDSEGGVHRRFAKAIRAAHWAVKTAAAFARQNRSGVLCGGLGYIREALPVIENRGVIVMMAKALAGRFL